MTDRTPDYRLIALIEGSRGDDLASRGSQISSSDIGIGAVFGAQGGNNGSYRLNLDTLSDM